MNKVFCSSDEAVDDLLDVLSKDDLLAVDIETDGLGYYTNKIWSVQIGDRDTAILFPWNALNEASKDKLRKYSEGRAMIAHNAKFDYQFLYVNGFKWGAVYCTQESEAVLFQGKYFTYKLKDVLHRRFQISMDKEVREVFFSRDPKIPSEFQQRVNELGEWGAWMEDVIEYALNDIEYLHEIYDAQAVDAKELGMNNLHWLENKLVPTVARMEARGVWLDKVATKKFHSKVLKQRDSLNLEIFGALEKSYNTSWRREYAKRMLRWDSWKSSHKLIVEASNKQRNPDDRRKKLEEAVKAVEVSNKKRPYATVPKEDSPFSPNSPIKLKAALEELTGLMIPTTGKEWLEENVDLHPAIGTLTEFRKYDKLCQFCELTNDINPITGKIHANFHQNGTKSGRFSCSDPNLQQIPARSEEAKEFRGLFRAAKGRKFVGADLAGIELVILAYFSGETILLDAINTGKDVHCFTMSLFLGCDYDSLVSLKKGSLPDTQEGLDSVIKAKARFENQFSMPELAKKTELTEWVGLLRDYTKTLTYGLAYGLSEFGLSRKFHCDYEDAQAFIKTFFFNYPNLKKFLTVQEDLGIQRLYAVNPLGRRRWFSYPSRKTYEQVEKEVIKALDKEKRLWDSVEDEEWESLMKEALTKAEKEFKSRVNGLKRQAGNFFPQSMCADMVKVAMVKFDSSFETDDESEGIILTIHDELIVDVREGNAARAKEVLEMSMVYAVKKFMPNVETKVDAKIMDRWLK